MVYQNQIHESYVTVNNTIINGKFHLHNHYNHTNYLSHKYHVFLQPSSQKKNPSSPSVLGSLVLELNVSLLVSESLVLLLVPVLLAQVLLVTQLDLVLLCDFVADGVKNTAGNDIITTFTAHQPQLVHSYESSSAHVGKSQSLSF